jgi:hypothetical protein
MSQNIALMGRARSGKDTVAARLVERHGFTRVAFADPLKEMALEIDPVIPTAYGIHVRLARLVADSGWEFAKGYPEVRRILQHCGQTVRDRAPGFWVALALRAVDAAPGPVVLSDVRYPNEAEALRARGFRLIRIIRPGYVQNSAKLHVSETALDRYPPDIAVVNAGSLSELHERADSLVK